MPRLFLNRGVPSLNGIAQLTIRGRTRTLALQMVQYTVHVIRCVRDRE